MASEPSPVAAEFMSDDDISLNSSDSEQEEEYTVEEIVAERVFDDTKPRYLVKWENYGEERCGLAFQFRSLDLCRLIRSLPLTFSLADPSVIKMHVGAC
jgi:Chromo (CHRromatin Organisation MOdifier) domain